MVMIFLFKKRPTTIYLGDISDNTYSRNFELMSGFLNIEIIFHDAEDFKKTYGPAYGRMIATKNVCKFYQVDSFEPSNELNLSEFDRKQDISLIYPVINILVNMKRLFMLESYNWDSHDSFREISINIITLSSTKSLESVVNEFNKQEVLMRTL